MKEWEEYWDKHIDPETFMRSPIEPDYNPIRLLIAEESVGDSVLDAGCASCISYPLFEGKMEYVGIDKTQKLLDSAKKFNKGVSLVRGKVHNMPFADNSFGTVFIKDVLEHIGPEEYKQVISEIWRIAKYRVLIALFGGVHHPTKYKLSSEHGLLPEYGIYYFNSYSREDLSNFISQLPNLGSFKVVENLPLENSSLTPRDFSTLKTARTLIIINKKGSAA